jgi:hypothetical protein
MFSVVVSRIEPLPIDGKALRKNMIPSAVESVRCVLNRAEDNPAVDILQDFGSISVLLLVRSADKEDVR